jgi:magnesium transporter
MPAALPFRVTVLRGDQLVVDPPEPLEALARGDGQVLWVDGTSPAPEALARLAALFDLHPLAVEDAVTRRQRPKVEDYGRYLFVTMHAARLRARGHDVVLDELDVFCGRGFVITVHDGAAPVLEEVRHRLAQAPPEVRTADGYLLYVLLDTAVDTFFPVLDALDASTERLEDALFTGPGPRTMDRLFRVKRALLHLRRVAAPQRDAMNVLLRHDLPLVAPALRPYFRDVHDHLLRIVEQIDTHRDLLAGALDVSLSLTSHRLNEVMKVLTVITAVFASLAVISGVYGMNFQRAYPPFDWPWGFPAALGVMAASVIIMLAVFRRLRWL